MTLKGYLASFHMLIYHHTFSLWMYLFLQMLCLFLSWDFCFLTEFRAFFIYSWWKSFIGYMIYKYFLPIYGLSFYTLKRVSFKEKFLTLIIFNLSIFLLWILLLVSYLNNCCLFQTSQIITHWDLTLTGRDTHLHVHFPIPPASLRFPIIGTDCVVSLIN